MTKGKDAAEIGAGGGAQAIKERRKKLGESATSPNQNLLQEIARVVAAHKPASDFLVVDRITVQTSDPPTYTLTINGVSFEVSAARLKARPQFELRLMEVLRRTVPNLPMTKGGDYREWLNELLERAEEIEAAPEASPDVAERAQIACRIRGMPLATSEDVRQDLDRGCLVPVGDGTDDRYLSFVPLLGALSSTLPGLTSTRLASQLQKLGWKDGPVRFGEPERQKRVWRGSIEQGDDE